MAKYQVYDEHLGKLGRKQAELFRRVSEGSLDPEVAISNVQRLAEGRTFPVPEVAYVAPVLTEISTRNFMWEMIDHGVTIHQGIQEHFGKGRVFVNRAPLRIAFIPGEALRHGYDAMFANASASGLFQPPQEALLRIIDLMHGSQGYLFSRNNYKREVSKVIVPHVPFMSVNMFKQVDFNISTITWDPDNFQKLEVRGLHLDIPIEEWDIYDSVIALCFW